MSPHTFWELLTQPIDFTPRSSMTVKHLHSQCSVYYECISRQHSCSWLIMELTRYLRWPCAHPLVLLQPLSQSSHKVTTLTEDKQHTSTEKGLFCFLKEPFGYLTLRWDCSFSVLVQNFIFFRIIKWVLTFRASLVDAAPPGNIFSILIMGWTFDSIPPDMLIPEKEKWRHEWWDFFC